MEIFFDNNKLHKWAENKKKCQQKLGARNAELFLDRLEALYNADSLEDTRHLPGRFHELTSNLKGVWSCDLEHPYRLIFKPTDSSIPVNETGNYIWSEIKSITILSILDYH